MKHVNKAFLASLFILVLAGSALSTTVPIVAFAETATAVGGSADPKQADFQIVPCTGVAQKDADGNVISGRDCDFNALIEMANRIIKFLLYLSIPVVLAIIMYTAFLYLMSNGNPAKLEKAKHMFRYVAIGLIWILISFILVYTVLDNLLAGQIKTDQQGIWNSYFKK
ncbi:MAG: hypothetical protein WC763_01405 [Candidatus Paceibacterota bacterium]|jgi:hypothetical protein